MTTTYSGRLVCDGYGNLLADEGDRAGDPVAHDPNTGKFIFLERGEPSHNERHHKRFAEMAGTQHLDPDQPGYAGSSEDDAPEGTEHHWGVRPDDDHADGMKFHPDRVAAKVTGHTDAWS